MSSILSLLVLLASIVVVTHCQTPTKIYFPGSEFTYTAIQAWGDDYILQNPSIAVEYSPMPSSQALEALLNNTSVIAAVDAPVTEDVYSSTPDLQVFLFFFFFFLQTIKEG